MTSLSSRKWWALGALTLAILAVGLDATVLSLALPTLATALNASESDLQWFVAAYSLVLAAAMLPGGLLGDRFGRKKMLLVALTLFGAGSVACAYAPSPAALIAARAVLGLGAAFIVTLSLSVLTVLFQEQERARAVGVWAAANFLALPVGPLLGGWILTNFWWGWVFLINVPVVVLALVAVAAILPESRSAVRSGLDPLGILASSGGLVGVTYALIQAGQHGWGDPSATVPLIGGALVLVGFLFWERRLSRLPNGNPLVDMGLFRSASFTWGTILAATGILAMFAALFAVPQYFQAVLGLDAQGSGLRLLPLIAGVVIGAVAADRLAARAGAKFAVAFGFAALAGGLFLGAGTTANSDFAFVAAWMTLCGIGMGLALATAASLALSQLSAERAGVGSAVMQTVQKIGGPLGVAILGSVLESTYQARVPVAGLPQAAADAVLQSVFAGVAVARRLGSPQLLEGVRAAFVAGFDAMLWVAGGIAMVGIILALLFLPRRSTVVAQAKAEALELGGTEDLEKRDVA